MQIRINLLPEARTTPVRMGVQMGPWAEQWAVLRARITDAWLVGAVGSVAVALVAVVLLFSAQQARASELEARLAEDVRDSTRFAGTLAISRQLAAERDSVERKVRILRDIDDTRYTWAHLLDEVSRVLPAYTWLTAVEQTSAAPLPFGADTLGGRPPARAPRTPRPAPAATPARGAPGAGAATATRTDTIAATPDLTFRVAGQTVDIQALTRYMRDLESSPFIREVSLRRSEGVLAEGKEVTAFELHARYEVPPPGAVTTRTLVIPIR